MQNGYIIGSNLEENILSIGVVSSFFDDLTPSDNNSGSEISCSDTDRSTAQHSVVNFVPPKA